MDNSWKYPFNKDLYVSSYYSPNSSHKLNYQLSLESQNVVDTNQDLLKCPFKLGNTAKLDRYFKGTNFKTLRNKINIEATSVSLPYLKSEKKFVQDLYSMKNEKYLELHKKSLGVRSQSSSDLNSKKKMRRKSIVMKQIQIEKQENINKPISEDLWKRGAYDDQTLTQDQKKSKKYHIYKTILENTKPIKIDTEHLFETYNDDIVHYKMSNIINQNNKYVKLVDNNLRRNKINFDDNKIINSDKMYENLLKSQWDNTSRKLINRENYIDKFDEWMDLAVKHVGEVDKASMHRLFKISLQSKAKSFVD